MRLVLILIMIPVLVLAQDESCEDLLRNYDTVACSDAAAQANLLTNLSQVKSIGCQNQVATAQAKSVIEQAAAVEDVAQLLGEALTPKSDIERLVALFTQDVNALLDSAEIMLVNSSDILFDQLHELFVIFTSLDQRLQKLTARSLILATKYKHLEHEVAAIMRKLQGVSSQESIFTASVQERNRSIRQSISDLEGAVGETAAAACFETRGRKRDVEALVV